MPQPSARGRCNRTVYRVLRSTRVPIAERPEPMIRSPSQCPGTARSSASAGRWLIMTSLGDMAAWALTRAGARDAQRTSGPQARDELALERAAALHVERLVDRLVRDPHPRIIGELQLESLGD